MTTYIQPKATGAGRRYISLRGLVSPCMVCEVLEGCMVCVYDTCNAHSIYLFI